jgi:hypothetical protein
VDDSTPVSVVQRFAEVAPDFADFAVAERIVAAEVGQGVAVDQLGDEQGVAVLLAHLIERDDAGMIEAGRRLGLTHHAARAGRATGIDRLDRDRALETAVPGLIDRAEAAAADTALDQEAVEYERADHSTSALRRESASSCDILPASWRIPPQPGRVVGHGRAVAPNVSRSCCAVAWRSAEDCWC